MVVYRVRLLLCSSVVVRRSFAWLSISWVFVFVFVGRYSSIVPVIVDRVCLRLRVGMSLFDNGFCGCRSRVFSFSCSSVLVCRSLPWFSVAYDFVFVFVSRYSSIVWVFVDSECHLRRARLLFFIDRWRSSRSSMSSPSCPSFVVGRSFACSSIASVFVFVFFVRCSSIVFMVVDRVCLFLRVRLSSFVDG